MTTKEQILNASDAWLEPVEVPEWGCTVYVPVLTIEDVTEMSKVAKVIADPNVAAAVFILRDAEGRRLFTNAEAPALARKSMAVLNRVISKFNEINSIGENPAKN
jgi:hypothetical protein